MQTYRTYGFRPFFAAASFVALTVLALCSASSAANTSFGRPVSGRWTPQRGSVPHRLYVSELHFSTVLVYTDGQNPKLVGSITTGISAPSGMNVDPIGDLFVTNSPRDSSGSVTVYPPGATSPSLTIMGGLASPNSVAIAPDGTVYVTDSRTSEVQEYHPGATQPFLTIPVQVFPREYGVASPADVAVDRLGNAYVYYDVDYALPTDPSQRFAGHIIEFAPGQVLGKSLHVVTDSGRSIDIDSLGRFALEMDSTFSGTYVEVRSPSGHRVLDNWPDGNASECLRIGSDEKEAYAADSDTGLVNVFSYPDGQVIRSVQTPMGGYPIKLAVSPRRY